jgi:hypothetical protein
MMRRVLPFAGAIVLALAVIAFGAGWLYPRAQAPAISATTAAAGHAHGDPAAATYAPLSLVPPADGSRVVMSTAAAAKPEQGYLVSAKVTSPAGKSVGEATVRFYDIVELFGQREELIGTASTDGQGQAQIAYLPATTGTHKLVARFAGQGALVPSLGVADLEATVAAPKYKVDQPGLAAFSRYVPYGAGVLVLAVWSLIAFSALSTVRGVAARVGDTQRKGDTA